MRAIESDIRPHPVAENAATMRDGQTKPRNVTLTQKSLYQLSLADSQVANFYKKVYPKPAANLKGETFWCALGQELATGILAGCSIAYLTFPIEGIKKWRQAYLDQQAKQHTGEKAYQFKPYRGSTVFAASIVPTTAVQFSVYSKLAPWIQDEKLALWQKIPFAFACGLAGAPFATFVELTVVKQQLLKSGMFQAIRHTYANSGVRGMFRSLSMIGGRDGIFTTWMFLFNPAVQQWAVEKTGNPWVSLPTGFASGLVGAAVTQPLDTIGTTLQKSPKPISIREAVEQMLEHTDKTATLGRRYVQALFKGLAQRSILFPVYCIVIPAFQNMFNRHVLSENYQNRTAGNSFGFFNYQKFPAVLAESQQPVRAPTNSR